MSVLNLRPCRVTILVSYYLSMLAKRFWWSAHSATIVSK